MKTIWALVFLWVSIFGFSAVGVENPESFIRSQKNIRIYVDSAPGFGHQSAGASVMQRLREIGFTGDFEVIYQTSVSAKLARIYPAFPRGVENQVHYLSVAEYRSRLQQGEVQHVQLAFSGADDGFGESFAKIANSESYLRLQPLGWGVSRIYGAENSRIEQVSGLPLASIQTDSRDAELDVSMKTFMQKYSQIAETEFTFPIYGVGIQTFAAQKIYFYAKAVLTAAFRMDPKKAVVIPVVSNFNTSEFDTLLKTFGKSEGFEAATDYELRQQKKFHFLSPSEFVEITNLIPGHLYFVMTGSVPQIIFNQFYKSATMPVWVAGKNAMSFAATSGKPYFNTVDDYHLPELKTISSVANKKLERAKAAFSSGYQVYVNQAQLTAVSQFIQESSTPGTELNQYYKNLGTKMSASDKVLEAVRALKLAKQCEAIF